VNRRRLACVAMLVLLAACGASCRIARLGGWALFGREEVPVSLAQARVRVAYNLRRGHFRVTRVRNSIRLQDVATILRLGDRTFASTDDGCRNEIVQRDALRLVIRSSLAQGPAWESRFEIRLHPDEQDPMLDRILRESYGVALTCRLLTPAEPGAAAATFALAGRAEAGTQAYATGLPPGPPAAALAAPPAATTIHDPERNCAVYFGADRIVVGPKQPRRLHADFPIRLEFSQTASIDFIEEVGQVANLPKAL